jgi:1-phosphofructokinase
VITTVTLNPSFDLTLQVEELRVGRVSRSRSERVEAAGKGVNVSRALAAHGVPSRAVVALAPVDERRYQELLDFDGPLEIIPAPGPVRTNTAIVGPPGVVTKVNAPGPTHTPEVIRALTGSVADAVDGSEWVVLSGSLPPGCPDDLYATLIRAVRSRAGRVALDAAGEPLRHGVAAGPDLVKPNRWELQETWGSPVGTLGDAVTGARAMLAGGAGAVLCSLGPDGALLLTGDAWWHATAEPFDVGSDVGAGDALLAGFLAAGGFDGEALRTAVAWGTAACRLPGAQMPGPDDVRAEHVAITERS